MMYLGLGAAVLCCLAMLLADQWLVPLAVWLGVGLGGAICLWRGRGRSGWVITGVLLLAMAVGAVRMEQAGRQYAGLRHELAQADVILQGTIVTRKRTFSTAQGEMARYVVAVEQMGFADDGLVKETGGSIYLTIPALPAYEPTETIQFRGIVKPITYYRNKGMYDALHRDKEQEIFLKAHSQQVESTRSVAPPQGWRYVLYTWRERMTARFMAVLPTEQAHVLSSLLFGGHYEELPPALVDSFSATGLIHILSVSGSHMALLLSIVQLIGKTLGLRQRALFGISLLFVLVYGALAEFTAPVVRSAIMGLLAAYSLTAQREYVSYQALGLAILAMVLYSPYLVYDISFRLSCGASAGIILLQPKIIRFLQFLPTFLRNSLAVCLSAQLLVLPVICANFFALPVYTILANLCVGPVLDMVIVLGLGAAVTGAVIPYVGEGLLHLIEPLLNLGIRGNYFLSSLPHSRYWLGALPVAYVLAWYGAVCAIFGPARYRRTAAVTAGTLCLGALLWYQWQAPEAKVLVLDVGNDQATCVTFPDKTSYLWYNKSEWSNPEQATVVLTPALRYAGIFRLTKCTVTGHEAAATGAQIMAAFTLAEPIQYPRQPVQEAAVVSGTIPYYVYQSSQDVTFPGAAVLEIRDVAPFRAETFPSGAAALIVHGKSGRTSEVYTDWLEEGAALDIPVFSPRRDGQIEGTYRQGAWTFTTYGGEEA